MRSYDNPPQFERLLNDLRRAQEAWQYGDREKAQRILKMVGSIALAESSERDPNAPVPETQS